MRDFSWWMTLLVGLLITRSSFAAEVRLTIDAGEVARHQSPVLAMVRDSSLPGGPCTRSPADGPASASLVGQVERAGDKSVIRWIERDLPAGASRTYIVRSAAAPVEMSGFHFKDGDGFRDLIFGDAPVLRDMIKYDPADRDNTYKPYTHVFGFHDEGFITKGAGGKYPHHRGIFFGFKAFDGKTLLGDFWHCPDVTQRHVKYLSDREFAGPVAARSAQVVEWFDKTDKPVVRDTREMTTWRIAPNQLVLDCEITVESLTGGAVQLGGDAHHAGYHFRAAQEVADAKSPDGKPGGGAVYTRPPTAQLMKDDIWSGCPWVHCAFEVKGHRYQLTHMDGPENPRPTTYSTRPYGRVGAFFTSEITPTKPLHVRYRLLLNEEAAPTAEQLAASDHSFTTPASTPP